MAQIRAVPRFTQWLGLDTGPGRDGMGSVVIITRLVDRPVVDSVPCRSSVLYTGQSYRGSPKSMSGVLLGRR